MTGIAYLYQSVNLLITILMVPLLLRYLDEGGYVLWSVFTTFGGVTLQLESAIQMISVREISKEYHSGSMAMLKAVIKKAKKAYLLLTVFVLIPFFLCGVLYVKYIVSDKIGTQGSTEWCVFVLAYAINYYFAVNNSILLGMVKISQYNVVNTLTRVTNFITTYVLLELGFSVLGVSLSFAVSVLIGVFCISMIARKTLEECSISIKCENKKKTKAVPVDSSNIFKYILYMLAAFVLYKGGFLVAITVFPKELVASYGLTLQANAMLSIFALVLPLQVRLHKLVRAVNSRDQGSVLQEFVVGIMVANFLFILGSVFLVVVGNWFLVFIDSKVMFIDTSHLLLVSFAFLVELNIMLLINLLVIIHKYQFVKIYICIAFLGGGCAFFLVLWSKSDMFTLIIVPLSLQFFLCLPLVFMLVSREMNFTPNMLVREVGRLVFKFGK